MGERQRAIPDWFEKNKSKPLIAAVAGSETPPARPEAYYPPEPYKNPQFNDAGYVGKEVLPEGQRWEMNPNGIPVRAMGEGAPGLIPGGGSAWNADALHPEMTPDKNKRTSKESAPVPAVTSRVPTQTGSGIIGIPQADGTMLYTNIGNQPGGVSRDPNTRPVPGMNYDPAAATYRQTALPQNYSQAAGERMFSPDGQGATFRQGATAEERTAIDAQVPVNRSMDITQNRQSFALPQDNGSGPVQPQSPRSVGPRGGGPGTHYLATGGGTGRDQRGVPTGTIAQRGINPGENEASVLAQTITQKLMHNQEMMRAAGLATNHAISGLGIQRQQQVATLEHTRAQTHAALTKDGGITPKDQLTHAQKTLETASKFINPEQQAKYEQQAAAAEAAAYGRKPQAPAQPQGAVPMGKKAPSVSDAGLESLNKSRQMRGQPPVSPAQYAEYKKTVRG